MAKEERFDGDPVLKHLMSGGRATLQEALSFPPLRSLVDQVNGPWPPLTSHKSAGHPLHTLVFLSELGISEEELGVQMAVRRLLSSLSTEGLFQVPVKIPVHFGGSGELSDSWALCDAPLCSYALINLGHGDEVIGRSIDTMRAMVRENGWPCVTSPSMGGFHGPGKKGDPCPYANLIMLRLLSTDPSSLRSNEARQGYEAAMDLWTNSRQVHPYQFYMGTDFRKLKLPFIWYDIMHFGEVMSRYPWARDDERFRDVMSIIRSSGNGSGHYIPGSVWTAWKDWDFGQKKEPSRWLEFAIRRIEDRLRD
ncbi:MAG: hypothetical protein A4E32_01059 [Methanomassiliicoccales archaeon PtaU1.Bin124]|nr:MAG: hypothetical protein A4E32_01059 [Methanomassiliicoccales archaeon PtaU1.Bin124]